MNRALQNLLAFGAAAFIVGPVAGADWPQFLGPNRDGTSSENGLADAWPADGPRVVWQAQIGQGFSGPVVARGRLVLFHRLADKEIVDCRDAKTGRPLWQFAYPTHYQDDFGFDEGPRATPAIADEKVYSLGAEGAVHCLDFKTGGELWSLDCKKEFHAQKGFFGMACSPLVEGDAVLLNVGGDGDSGIVALDKITGKPLWKKTRHEAGYASPVAATINGRRYALSFNRDGLTALNPADGRLYFEFPWRARMSASVNAATPIVLGDLVFLSASYGTGAVLLRVKEGGVEKVWTSDEALSCHYATAILREGSLYGIDGRTDPGMEPRPSLRCVEWNTGRVRWSQENFGAATLLLAGTQLLMMTEQGELLRAAANPKQFKIDGRAQILPVGVRAFPALAEGLFYARSKDKLVCVDLK
jgi:outer membrane protein assembly factor BamB